MQRRFVSGLCLIVLILLNATVLQAQDAPFISEEVVFTNEDITLSGTLTLPNTNGPHPVAIVISGSGEQNRDGETAGFLPGYAPSRFLAEELTSIGIAVLRYDERGVDGSTGTHYAASTADFADDAEAAMVYLLSRDDVDVHQIGLIGHSEGSNIAAIVAARNPQVAFAISLAGPAVNGYDLMIEQTMAVAEASGASQEDIAAAVEFGRTEWDMVLVEDWAGIEELSREFFAAMPDDQRPNPEVQDALIARQEVFAKNWLSFLLTYDPAEDWAMVEAPVLAIFAELDSQVTVRQNYPAMTEALENGNTLDYEIIALDDTNHLFQPNAETGALEEYATLEPVFTPDMLDVIREWLLAHVTVC